MPAQTITSSSSFRPASHSLLHHHWILTGSHISFASTQTNALSIPWYQSLLRGVRIGYEAGLDFRIKSETHRSGLLQADVIIKSLQSEIIKAESKRFRPCQTTVDFAALR